MQAAMNLSKRYWRSMGEAGRQSSGRRGDGDRCAKESARQLRAAASTRTRLAPEGSRAMPLTISPRILLDPAVGHFHHQRTLTTPLPTHGPQFSPFDGVKG